MGYRGKDISEQGLLSQIEKLLEDAESKYHDAGEEAGQEYVEGVVSGIKKHSKEAKSEMTKMFEELTGIAGKFRKRQTVVTSDWSRVFELSKELLKSEKYAQNVENILGDIRVTFKNIGEVSGIKNIVKELENAGNAIESVSWSEVGKHAKKKSTPKKPVKSEPTEQKPKAETPVVQADPVPEAKKEAKNIEELEQRYRSLIRAVQEWKKLSEDVKSIKQVKNAADLRKQVIDLVSQISSDAAHMIGPIFEAELANGFKGIKTKDILAQIAQLENADLLGNITEQLNVLNNIDLKNFNLSDVLSLESGASGHFIELYDVLKKIAQLQGQMSAPVKEATDAIEAQGEAIDKVAKQMPKMESVIKRYNKLMSGLGLEHLTIGEQLGEDTEGWGIKEMVEEAKYQLSTFYDQNSSENVFMGKDEMTDSVRKRMMSDIGKLKRFITAYEPYIDVITTTVAEVQQATTVTEQQTAALHEHASAAEGAAQSQDKLNDAQKSGSAQESLEDEFKRKLKALHDWREIAGKLFDGRGGITRKGLLSVLNDVPDDVATLVGDRFVKLRKDGFKGAKTMDLHNMFNGIMSERMGALGPRTADLFELLDGIDLNNFDINEITANVDTTYLGVFRQLFDILQKITDARKMDTAITEEQTTAMREQETVAEGAAGAQERINNTRQSDQQQIESNQRLTSSYEGLAEAVEGYYVAQEKMRLAYKNKSPDAVQLRDERNEFINKILAFFPLDAEDETPTRISNDMDSWLRGMAGFNHDIHVGPQEILDRVESDLKTSIDRETARAAEIASIESAIKRLHELEQDPYEDLDDEQKINEVYQERLAIIKKIGEVRFKQYDEEEYHRALEVTEMFEDALAGYQDDRDHDIYDKLDEKYYYNSEALSSADELEKLLEIRKNLMKDIYFKETSYYEEEQQINEEISKRIALMKSVGELYDKGLISKDDIEEIVFELGTLEERASKLEAIQNDVSRDASDESTWDELLDEAQMYLDTYEKILVTTASGKKLELGPDMSMEDYRAFLRMDAERAKSIEFVRKQTQVATDVTQDQTAALREQDDVAEQAVKTSQEQLKVEQQITAEKKKQNELNAIGYHGTTTGGYREVDMSRARNSAAFWLTDNVDLAARYANGAKKDVDLESGEQNQRGIYTYKVNGQNVWVVDAKGNGSGALTGVKADGSDTATINGKPAVQSDSELIFKLASKMWYEFKEQNGEYVRADPNKKLVYGDPDFPGVVLNIDGQKITAYGTAEQVIEQLLQKGVEESVVNTLMYLSKTGSTQGSLPFNKKLNTLAQTTNNAVAMQAFANGADTVQFDNISNEGVASTMWAIKDPSEQLEFIPGYIAGLKESEAAANATVQAQEKLNQAQKDAAEVKLHDGPDGQMALFENMSVDTQEATSDIAGLKEEVQQIEQLDGQISLFDTASSEAKELSTDVKTLLDSFVSAFSEMKEFKNVELGADFGDAYNQVIEGIKNGTFNTVDKCVAKLKELAVVKPPVEPIEEVAGALNKVEKNAEEAAQETKNAVKKLDEVENADIAPQSDVAEQVQDNNKLIESYEELCTVLYRYYELLAKGNSISDNEAAEKSALFNTLANTMKNAVSNGTIQENWHRDNYLHQKVVGQNAPLWPEEAAEYLGIKIPEAAKEAESAVRPLIDLFEKLTDLDKFQRAMISADSYNPLSGDNLELYTSYDYAHLSVLNGIKQGTFKTIEECMERFEELLADVFNVNPDDFNAIDKESITSKQQERMRAISRRNALSAQYEALKKERDAIELPESVFDSNYSDIAAKRDELDKRIDAILNEIDRVDKLGNAGVLNTPFAKYMSAFSDALKQTGVREQIDLWRTDLETFVQEKDSMSEEDRERQKGALKARREEIDKKEVEIARPLFEQFKKDLSSVTLTKEEHYRALMEAATHLNLMQDEIPAIIKEAQAAKVGNIDELRKLIPAGASTVSTNYGEVAKADLAYAVESADEQKRLQEYLQKTIGNGINQTSDPQIVEFFNAQRKLLEAQKNNTNYADIASNAVGEYDPNTYRYDEHIDDIVKVFIDIVSQTRGLSDKIKQIVGTNSFDVDESGKRTRKTFSPDTFAEVYPMFKQMEDAYTTSFALFEVLHNAPNNIGQDAAGKILKGIFGDSVSLEENVFGQLAKFVGTDLPGDYSGPRNRMYSLPNGAVVDFWHMTDLMFGKTEFSSTSDMAEKLAPLFFKYADTALKDPAKNTNMSKGGFGDNEETVRQIIGILSPYMSQITSEGTMSLASIYTKNLDKEHPQSTLLTYYKIIEDFLNSFFDSPLVQHDQNIANEIMAMFARLAGASDKDVPEFGKATDAFYEHKKNSNQVASNPSEATAKPNAVENQAIQNANALNEQAQAAEAAENAQNELNAAVENAPEQVQEIEEAIKKEEKSEAIQDVNKPAELVKQVEPESSEAVAELDAVENKANQAKDAIEEQTQATEEAVDARNELNAAIEAAPEQAPKIEAQTEAQETQNEVVQDAIQLQQQLDNATNTEPVEGHTEELQQQAQAIEEVVQAQENLRASEAAMPTEDQTEKIEAKTDALRQEADALQDVGDAQQNLQDTTEAIENKAPDVDETAQMKDDFYKHLEGAGKATEHSDIDELERILAGRKSLIDTAEQVGFLSKEELDTEKKITREIEEQIAKQKEAAPELQKLNEYIHKLPTDFRGSEQYTGIIDDLVSKVRNGIEPAEQAIKSLDAAFESFAVDAVGDTDKALDEVIAGLTKLSASEISRVFNSISLSDFLKAFNIDKENFAKFRMMFEELLQIDKALQDGTASGNAFTEQVERITDAIVHDGGHMVDLEGFGTVDEMERFRKYMSGQVVRYTDSTRKEYTKDEWASLKKRFGSRITTDETKGITANELWDELVSEFPSLFSSRTENDKDQFKALFSTLGRVIDASKTGYKTKKGFTHDDRGNIQTNMVDIYTKMQALLYADNASATTSNNIGPIIRDLVSGGSGGIDGGSGDGMDKKDFNDVLETYREYLKLLKEIQVMDLDTSRKDHTDQIANKQDQLIQAKEKLLRLGVDIEHIAENELLDLEQKQQLLKEEDKARRAMYDVAANKTDRTSDLHSKDYDKVYSKELSESRGLDTQIRAIGDDNVGATLQSKIDAYKRLLSELEVLDRQLANNKALATDSEFTQNFEDTALKVKNARVEIDGILKQSQNLEKISKGSLISIKEFDSSGLNNLRTSMIAFGTSLEGGEFKLKGFNKAGTEMYGVLDDGSGVLKNITVALDGASDKLVAYGTTTERVSNQWEDFKSEIAAGAKNIVGMYVGFQEAMQAVSQGVEYVKEIDLAMTELKKVTDETDLSYKQFLEDAAGTSAVIGSTISDFTEATATFARLGYSLEEASSMAETALVYKNVADGMDTVEAASDSIISTMMAFGIEADNTMSIVDKFNAVGNHFAITSAGIGEALTRSASALYSAGNTIDESVALVTAANSVVQNPEQVGKTLADYKVA